MASKNRTLTLKLFVLLLGFFGLVILILTKIWIYKVVEHEKWSKLQQKYVFKIKTIPATRGNILSENNFTLVTSVPFYEVRWDAKVENLTDKKFSENVDSLACCLARIFNKPTDYFFKKLIKARTIGNRYTLIAGKVNYNQLEKIKKCPIFSWGKFKGGLIVNTREVRAKSFEYSSRTLGYKKEDGTGIGLEKAYDKYLRGVNGKKLVQKISGRYYREVRSAENIEPQNGYDIRTTLNVEIEDITHNSLLRMLKATQADHGVAVVMEVKTGDIKAISNLGRTKDGNYEEKYNYAIGELYEPGSTFKLASMIVALDKGVTDLYDSVDTRNGTIRYYNHIMRDAHAGLGKIPVIEAFAHSSNVGISQIIYNNFKDHPEDFIDRLYAMHLNDALGIEIKGEKRPVIHYPGDKYWSGLSLPQIAIGYEVRITPLQLLTLYNAIANGGEMVKPRFVTAVLNHGKVVKEFEPQVIEPKICSSETVKKARKLLEAVVEYGTAKGIKTPYYKIAGKTGTAVLANRNSGYKTSEGKSYVASFVGYFPADNPMYSIIVTVHKPKGAYYGSQVAAPVFREIADKIYATQFKMHEPINIADTMIAEASVPIVKYGYAPDIESLLDDLDVKYNDKDLSSDWAVTFSRDSVIVLKNRFIHKGIMPNVKGMGLRDATYILNSMGLKVDPVGEGTVVYQSVNPGLKVSKGQEVILKLL